MGLHNDDYKTLEIMLTGSNNRTLKGVLNFTAADLGGYSEEDEVYDGTGAATFVIVVILVYGLSIVLMIGSLAKKNMKLKDIDLEEKQIHRYLSQANDLREKGAKENYRQLKRTIISLVNNIPESGDNKKDTTSVGTNILRSMVAVGSPAVAGLAEQKDPDDKEGETSGNPPSRGVRSDSESLRALLEEDEDVSDDAQTSAVNRQITSQPRQCIVSQRYHDEPAKTTLLKPTTSSPRAGRPETDPRRSPSARSNAPPRVVVSSLQEGGYRNRPSGAKVRSENMLSPLEKDSKIIYKVDERTSGESGKPCKLTMDAEGNIWILQASPEVEGKTSDRLTPSPALPSPRSLGYESLSESRTPSPHVFSTLSPPPVGSSRASPGGSPRSSPRGSRNYSLGGSPGDSPRLSPRYSPGNSRRYNTGTSPGNSPKYSPRIRQERSSSPRLGVSVQGDRSHAPRDRSHLQGDRPHPQGDRSRTPIPTTPPHSPSVCCEHKHNLILTASANLLPSGRRSPHHEPRESGMKEPVRIDHGAHRNDLIAAPIAVSAGASALQRSSFPPGSDEEELVQITTV